MSNHLPNLVETRMAQLPFLQELHKHSSNDSFSN